MAEMAAAIMVVSLPSMRAALRRGGIFAPRRTYGSSSSRTDHKSRTATNSSRFKSISTRGGHSSRIHAEEDSGSEVELNVIGRKDVIYETQEVTVQFSDSRDLKTEDYGRAV